MDLILGIITAYFFGKMAERKGYSSYRYRVRHICACIFTSMTASLISLSVQDNMGIASVTGIVATIGIIIYRYQVLSNLEPKEPE